MKLKTVQITNYKCIEDSSECSVGPVACLREIQSQREIVDAVSPWERTIQELD